MDLRIFKPKCFEEAIDAIFYINLSKSVILTHAGIHVDFELKSKMDSRVRENDEMGMFQKKYK